MGWHFIYRAKKADVVKLLLKPQPWFGASRWDNGTQKIVPLDYEISSHAIAHKLVKNTLWTVRQYLRRYPNGGVEVETIIVCNLLEKQGRHWGYKSMAECEGPYYYDCPLEFFDYAPETNTKWRNQVWEHQRTATVV